MGPISACPQCIDPGLHNCGESAIHQGEATKRLIDTPSHPAYATTDQKLANIKRSVFPRWRRYRQRSRPMAHVTVAQHGCKQIASSDGLHRAIQNRYSLWPMRSERTQRGRLHENGTRLRQKPASLLRGTRRRLCARRCSQPHYLSPILDSYADNS